MYRTPSARAFKKTRFLRVLSIAWLSYCALLLCRKPVSIARTKLQDELGLSTTTLGVIDSGFLATYCFGQLLYTAIPASYKKLYMPLFLSATCVFAVTMMPTGGSLVVLWTLNGLMQSFGWPSAVSTVSPWIGSAERGEVMGLWSTCQGAGGVMANFVITAVLVEYGWASSFLAVATITSGLGLICFFGLIESPAAAGFDGIPQELQLPDNTRVAEGAEGKKAAPSNRQIMGIPDVMELTASYFMQKFVRYSLLLWLPYYLTRVLGYSVGDAGYISAGFDIGGVAGPILAGRLADRFGGGKKKVQVMGMMLVLSVASLLIFWSSTEVMKGSKTLALVMTALIGAGSFGADSMVSGAIVQDLAELHGMKEHAGSFVGFVGGVGSLGAVLQGPVTAFISESYGWSNVIVFLVIVATCATLVLLRPMRRSSAVPATCLV